MLPLPSTSRSLAPRVMTIFAGAGIGKLPLLLGGSRSKSARASVALQQLFHLALADYRHSQLLRLV